MIYDQKPQKILRKIFFLLQVSGSTMQNINDLEQKPLADIDDC